MFNATKETDFLLSSSLREKGGGSSGIRFSGWFNSFSCPLRLLCQKYTFCSTQTNSLVPKTSHNVCPEKKEKRGSKVDL